MDHSCEEWKAHIKKEHHMMGYTYKCPTCQRVYDKTGTWLGKPDTHNRNGYRRYKEHPVTGQVIWC